jgi:hypothetical protein
MGTGQLGWLNTGLTNGRMAGKHFEQFYFGKGLLVQSPGLLFGLSLGAHIHYFDRVFLFRFCKNVPIILPFFPRIPFSTHLRTTDASPLPIT